MNVKISRGIGLVAALYFTANFHAQTTPKDTVQKEQKIEEVVVIGYGSVKKSNLTSAVSTVKAETFDDRPIYNVGQALQGNAAGVNVIQSSGKPGAAIDVKIRGNNSISSSVNPLYVVDGIQTFDISGINPDDITDMTILKDATSAAIYGINGSSGVVIVTTKRGKANKPQLAFNAYWGMSKTVNNIDVLNLDQYKTLMNEINLSYLTTINNPRYAGINTNWRDEVFRTGFDQNYNVNYSFGNEKVRAYTALGYQGIDGIIDPARFDRISAKMNLDAKITNWLKLTGNFNYINTTLKNTNDNLGTSRGGVILSALNTPSFLPIYGSQLAVRDKDTDGNFLDGYKDGQFALNPFQSSWENPVAYQSRKNETQTNRFMSNLGLEVSILKNLVWKPTVSFDLIESTNDQFTDGYQTSYGRQQKGIGGKYYSSYQDLNFENTLTYTLKSGAHDLSLLGGTQVHEKRNSWHNYWGDSFPEGSTMFDFNTAVNKHESLVKEHLRELSFFGRALYTLDNKYTVMGVFRYNGSSALAPGNKWGFFPGVSASWVVSNEDFLSDSRIISELKLRGGWGQTGNVSGIPSYSHFNLERFTELGPAGSVFTRQWDSGDLTWEVTNDTNIGVDFGFLNNKIKLSVDAYKRKTNDLIIQIPMGAAQVPFYRNVGSMENQGLEFSLNTQNFKGEFTWNTNFNISFTKNKVLQLNWVPVLDRANIETVGANLVRFTAGQPISSFYGYQVDHVDSQTGDLIYKDTNGNGYFDTGDRTFIGNPNPDFSFGFSNNFSYKNWYLDVLVTGSYGGEIYNASRFDLEMMNDFKNQSTAVLDRWTTPGQITNTPRANSASSQYVSDRFVEDGSFLKIKSATLGYNFLSPFKGVSKINLYVTGQNLLTWTDYTGFDPEVNAFNTTNGVSGIDYGTYPQVRTFIFGLKANF
ncbi:SusC/RagA family TonB-linked outer membrane protein [Chryseobacterium luquanense]|uniref:SusC/RagA family TonB-linked outer membrane protein n=1 Tax=Chryseobacterium luquanense TaxID=2983766 RepID=A0ABT3Y3B5_9FLAO|nr:SusC/RagA family TonB-linked outer membrane protein [Chryseobacterium luquanense]MCX8532643.1 SusC/RagA family TonB-linked outer membrane protein [Chryseobacterium luquanense]